MTHILYSIQHVKDAIQIRRTDIEMLRKQASKGGSNKSNGRSGGDETDQGNGDRDSESLLIINRDKCIPVVKGLMSLILSMDFTCNVDLFLVACKVSKFFYEKIPDMYIGTKNVRDRYFPLATLVSRIQNI